MKPKSKKESFFTHQIEQVEQFFVEEQDKRREKRIWKRARKRLQRRQLKKFEEE